MDPGYLLLIGTNGIKNRLKNELGDPFPSSFFYIIVNFL